MKDLPIQNDVKLLRLAEIIFNGTREKSESFPKCKFSRGMWAVFRKGPICLKKLEKLHEHSLWKEPLFGVLDVNLISECTNLILFCNVLIQSHLPDTAVS